jgi:hypothetical protein
VEGHCDARSRRCNCAPKISFLEKSRAFVALYSIKKKIPVLLSMDRSTAHQTGTLRSQSKDQITKISIHLNSYLIIIPDTNANAPLSLSKLHPMIPNIPKLFPSPDAPKLLNQTQSPSQASAPATQSACASYIDPPHPQDSDANDISGTDRLYPVTLTLRDYSDNIPVLRARRWVKGVISVAE